MKDILIKAEITFLENAKTSFNFPIVNSVRLSFWLANAKASTFSEIQIQNEFINIGQMKVVYIRLTERDFLLGKILVGADFKMGTFPNEIALGKVVEVLN